MTIIEKLLTSIANALKNNYPKSNVYVNAIEQGVKENDFFIIPITVDQKPLINNWWLLSFKIDVQVMIDSRMQALTIGSNLCDFLEYITYTDDKPIRGKDINYNYVGGILHFMIDYDIYVRGEVEPIEKMQLLDYKGNLKEDKGIG